MIFIFRQYDSNKHIIIYAESYLEAKEALFDFNQWADKTYNILEYKMYRINPDKYCEILNIEPDMVSYPRILSDNEFYTLENKGALLDKQFNDIHNIRVIQKKDIPDDVNGGLAVSTSEFVNMLKQNAEFKEHFKHEISKMLTAVGDIWFIKFRKANGINHLLCDDKGNSYEFYIYGRSRYQCIKLFNDLFDIHKQNYCPKPELLICEKPLASEYNEYTDDDVTNYKRMVHYMQEYNIKKFPFTTLEKEES